ncbi:MAG: mrdA [Gammaproteobacteria bacterium]|jgi:penicillin-binding protein 2|nr:mrdA [Gammaproteobacteria bacterium]
MREQTPLNDPILETRLFQQRVFITLVIIFSCFGILLLRLAYLQIFQHRYYTTLSQDNSIGLIPLQPPRGLIYDRNGKLLAENMPVFSLDITPNKVDDLDKTISELQQILSLDSEDVDRFYQQLNKKRAFDPIPLKIKLSHQDIAKFYVQKYRFPGVEVSVRLIRSYPYKNDFVAVLGYTGRINRQELETLDPNIYTGIDYIGKLGIEKYFENVLRGKVGFQKVAMNAQGQVMGQIATVSPVPGHNLYLTLDADLQEAALKAMRNYSGAVVAIEPSTGDVLAMVSTPSYDPEIFVRGITKKEYSELQNSPDQPLFNRAIRGQYPPASTIKPILALQGLEKKFVTPEFKIFDPGYFQLTPNGRRYRNWRPKGQGWINLRAAIAQSCDTYFYILANKMGIAPITEIETAFGYGSLTGIQLNEELPGMVPSPENKRKLMKEAWYAGDTLNSSIGQGISLVTPLQLAMAGVILANRGAHPQANLVLEMRSPDGKIIPLPLRPPKPSVQLSPETWDRVIEGMMAVVTDPGGTGYRFGKPKYTVAIKTGTAQLFRIGQNEKYVASKVQQHLRDNSMLIAFAPVENPKIAVAVAVQNNPTASEIARQVMDAYLLREKQAAIPEITK